MTLSRYSSAAAAIALAFVTSSSAQAPQEATPEQRLLALAKEVQQQQAQVAANQEKIEAKLVAVTEAVRVAKIYSSRGGR